MAISYHNIALLQLYHLAQGCSPLLVHVSQMIYPTRLTGLTALGGVMHFIIACWDLQKPVAIIGKGFETFLHHVHALFQQLPSY